MTADTPTTDRTDPTLLPGSDPAHLPASRATPPTGGDNPNFIANDLDRIPDKTFRDYKLDHRLVEALEAKGIIHPFPIQELTLPVALQGQDIIGQARTGTGKTLGFGLPMIQRLDPDAPHTQALIVTPTRELCIQVYEELRICETMGFTSTTVYGGVGYDEQIEALDGGVDIVVGTPGRLLDMLGRGHLDLSRVQCLILDEADEMLDMGFLPDVERLLNAANEEGRHTMLFSATMPASVVKLARRYTDNPLFMGADSVAHETAPLVDQYFFHVFRMDKPRVLARILQQPDRGNAMVFTRTKAMADRLVRELDDLGVKAIAIHGDLRQAAREKNLGQFRTAEVDVLCATEVAARGIDVENVTHVINYDLPDDEKMYLHRIGRTARAGAAGAAITFAEHNELARLHMIKKAMQEDEETPEVFSTSDLLTELFDLPDETPWAHMSRSSGGSRRGGSRNSGSGSGGASGGGGSRSRSQSRGSLDSPRGDKHDGDLDSDHDRSRERVRREGRSLETRVRRHAETHDNGGGDAQDASRESSHESSRERSRSRSRSGGDSSGGSSSRRSSSRSSSSSSSPDNSSPDSSSADGGSSRSSSRSASRGSSGGSSKSSSGGRVRARGGKPVDDRASSSSSSSDSPSSDDSSSGRSSNRNGGGRTRNGGGNGGRNSGGNSGGTKSRNSGRNSSKGQTSGGSSSGGSDVDLPRKVQPTRAGSSARGEGNPRLERHVAVDHLP